MAHTPGPMSFEGRNKQGRTDQGVPYAWINLNAPGHIGGIQIIGPSSMTDEAMAGNARLFATSPDLLNGCRMAINAFNVEEIDPMAAFAVIERLRYLVNRVTGEDI